MLQLSSQPAPAPTEMYVSVSEPLVVLGEADFTFEGGIRDRRGRPLTDALGEFAAWAGRTADPGNNARVSATARRFATPFTAAIRCKARPMTPPLCKASR